MSLIMTSKNFKILILILFSFSNIFCLELNKTTSLQFLQSETHNISDSQKIEKITKILDSLFTKIMQSQSKKDVEFRQFPPRFSEIKGLFSSYIHLNFIDDENSFIGQISRNYLAALDMNMFVSNFVISSLLESFHYTSELKDQKLLELKKSISISLQALSQFRDRNQPIQNVPIYNFWRQKNINGTWSQSPDTMINNLPDIPDSFINILNKLGAKSLSLFISTFKSMTKSFTYAFRIPADADDTSVNMALTGYLFKFQNSKSLGDLKLFNKNTTKKNHHNTSLITHAFKELHNLIHYKKNNKTKIRNDKKINQKFSSNVDEWFKNNSNYEELFLRLKKTSYRPFSGNSTNPHVNNSDIIDPRTYYVLRKFLEMKKEMNQDLILPTTWILTLEEQKKFHPLVSMPFSVNNVDLNVATNFLFGITNLVLHHPNRTYIENIFDDEMQKMYSDTVELLTFSINQDIISWRPDLALLYYPSIFDFYWLTSRVYSTLKNHDLFNGNLQNQKIINLFNSTLYSLDFNLKKDLTNQMINKLNTVTGNDQELFFTEF